MIKRSSMTTRMFSSRCSFNQSAVSVLFTLLCLSCFNSRNYNDNVTVVVDAMAVNNNSGGNVPKKQKRIGCQVCVSSTCKGNGSEMLLDALETLVEVGAVQSTTNKNDDSVKIEFNKADYCLGGCCKGVIIKPYGTNTRRKTISGIIQTEQIAIDKAKTLLIDEILLDVDNDDNEDDVNTMSKTIDETVVSELLKKIESGETILKNSEPPEVCLNCGVSLQLYRGNCAKCGKYPY